MKTIIVVLLTVVFFTNLALCLSGEERAHLVTVIKVEHQEGRLNGHEKNILLAIIDQGKAWPEMVDVYQKKYKQMKKSIEEFVNDVNQGKLPQK